ncbi:hypothetical protein ES703_08498 [subsurface metagenome]
MASGRPDWYSSVSMHGKFDDKYIAVAVDTLGHMLAKMQGEKLDETLKTIAVDDDGIMKANLAVQTLPAMQVRPFYTELANLMIAKNCETGTLKLLTSHSGQGIILGGYISTDESVSMSAAKVMLVIDNKEVFDHSFASLEAFGLTSFDIYPVALSKYDDTGFVYCVTFAPLFTYEFSFQFYFYQATGVTRAVTGIIFRADVPS